MELHIHPFDTSRHYDGFLDLIRSEGEEWAEHLAPAYLNALEGSLTYMAFADGKVCGYIRAMSDFGQALYVVDLLVDKQARGNGIGKQLIQAVIDAGNSQEVYVMSDADGYYEKMGYQQVGSIFRLK